MGFILIKMKTLSFKDPRLHLSNLRLYLHFLRKVFLWQRTCFSVYQNRKCLVLRQQLSVSLWDVYITVILEHSRQLDVIRGTKWVKMFCSRGQIPENWLSGNKSDQTSKYSPKKVGWLHFGNSEHLNEITSSFFFFGISVLSIKIYFINLSCIFNMHRSYA